MSNVRRWTECEDWVEFYSQRELTGVGSGRYAAVMNFGGPGAAVPYHFYARVRDGAEGTIAGVEIEAERFEPVNRTVAVKGTPPGFRWVHLGFVNMRRNYRRVTILAPKGLAGLDRLCVLEIPLRLESGEIERRIARDGLPPEPLSGVPLGGVGAGKIEFCRDGLFRNITINGNIDTPIARSAASFFAVQAMTDEGSLARIVASERLHGLAPMETLEFEGVYPRAILKARDRAFPLAVEIQATGTIIPRNVKDSSLPLALFRVRLTACAEKPVKVTVAFAMENFLGCGGSVAAVLGRGVWDEGFYDLWEERTGNGEQPWESGVGDGVRFVGGEKEEIRSQGEYVLASVDRVGARLIGWRPERPDEVWDCFADSGRFLDASALPSQGEVTAGAVAVDVALAAGETRDLRFALAWYVPRFWQAEGPDYSHYYCNNFASAGEIAQYGLTNFDRLEAEARQIPDLVQGSTLPSWLARSVCNDAYVFSTATWLTKDGRFAVNEGPTHMFGCMGTLDQKLYANHYYSLFFPELDRTELLGFVRSQGENGGIQHDLGYGHLEQKGQSCGWPDLSSALAILSLKHYQLTGDQAYLDEVYPCLVRALFDYQLGMDTDGDGIANISGVGNTFDAEKYEGTSCYLASLWLAALKALEQLAAQRGDAAVAARCRQCFEKAHASAIKELWNGEFFVNYYDSKNQRQCPNSHYSQVAGEFFARLCGLGPLYGDHYVRQALRSMLRLNYHPRLRFPTNEATPEGKMSCRFMWGWLPHARVYLAGTPMYFGMAEEGLRVLERLEHVVAVLNHDNRWDQRLFYEPDTGREHWGRFYMTAPATWYVYQTLLGYRWDQPQGTLSLLPNLPSALLPFAGPVFLPDWWGWLTVSHDGSSLGLKIIKTFKDGLTVRQINVRSRSGTLALTANGAVISVMHGMSNGEEEPYKCSVDIRPELDLSLQWR